MRLFSLAVLLLIGLSPAQAQFAQKTIDAKSYPRSIYMFNTQLGFLGGSSMQKTTDGGDHWSPITFTGLDTIFMASLFNHHFHFFDSQHGLAVVTSLFDDSGAVIATSDGGAHWVRGFVDTPLNAFPFTGFTDVHFFDASHGFAVGGAGRRIITSDGGNSWTRSDLPVATDLYDIFFADSQNGYVAGENYIFKTTDGGTTWSSKQINGEVFTSLYFTDAMNGHAVSMNGHIYRTVDGGNTWSQYFFTYYQLNKIVFTDANNGFIAGDLDGGHNILRTLDGGQNWEAVAEIFPNGLTDIIFSDVNNGMACGTDFSNTSYFGKTSTGTGNTTPVTSFVVIPPGPLVCPGATFNFSNKGNAAYTHAWYVNNQLISNGYDFQYTFNNPGTYDIRLETTSNQSVTVTHSETVTVPDPAAYRYALSLNYNKIVCEGSYFAIGLGPNFYDQQNGPRIELWSNGQKLNPVRDQGTLILANGLSQTTTFTIKIFSNKVCYDPAQDTTFTVKVIPANYIPDVEVSKQVLCTGTSFYLVVHNSDPDLQYIYRSDFGDGSWQYGNGGDLIIEAFLPDYKQEGAYHISAFSQCKEYPGSSFTISHSTFKVKYEVNSIRLFNDEQMVITNNTTPAQYSWDLGEGAPQRFYNQQTPPPFQYGTTGLKKISLNAEDVNGCRSSKDTLVFIAEHVAGDPVISCGEMAIEFTHLEKVVDSKSDSFGNIYTAGMYPGPDIPPQFLSINNVFIEKIDAGGNRLWRKDVTATLNDEYNHFYGPTIFGIAVDGAGNVYAGINFDDAEAVISGVTFKDYHYGNVGKSVLCKFSPTGEFLWHIFIFDDLTNQDRGNRMNTFITAIALDRRGDILFDLEGFTSTTAMQLPNGDKVYGSNTYGGFAIVKVDQEGNYINHAPYTAQVSLTQPVVGWTLDRGKPLVAPKLFVDEANNVIFSGLYYHSEATFGNYVFPGHYYDYPQQIFNAILKDGEWISAFGGSQLTISYASTLNTAILASDIDQAVYVSGRLESPAPFFLVNGDTIDANKVNGYLIKWKYNGSIDWIKYTNNVTFQSFKKNPVTGIIQAVGTIDHFGVFDANSAHPKGIRSNGKHDPFTINFDNTGNTVSGVAIGTAADEYNNFLLESGCGQIAYVSLQEDAVVIRKSSTTGSCGQIPPPLSVQSNLVSICKGFETQLAATGADAYKWEPAVGLSNNTIGNPLASPSKTTVYTVTGYSDVNCLAQKQVRIVVQDSIPVFTYSRKNLLVHFRTDSQPGDTFSWDFGDGGQGSSNEVAHTYLQTGTYSVCLTTNNQCGIQTTCQDVAVDCSAPIPSILLGSVGDNYACQFLDVNDPELTLHWDFGDGGTSDERSPLHVFHSEGPFNVCLTATNNCMDSTYCTILELGCLSFVADFTAETNHIDGVHFVNKSINAYLWEWDFGDGSTSHEENPVHAYAVAGSYDVCLMAGNKCGYSNPFCKQVTATEAITTGVTKGPEDISAFPNPFHSQFSLLVPRPKDIEEIEIINNLGQVVHRITGVNSLNQINLAHCSAGLYHIRIWLRNEIISRSIIKLD